MERQLFLLCILTFLLGIVVCNDVIQTGESSRQKRQNDNSDFETMIDNLFGSLLGDDNDGFAQAATISETVTQPAHGNETSVLDTGTSKQTTSALDLGTNNQTTYPLAETSSWDLDSTETMLQNSDLVVEEPTTDTIASGFSPETWDPYEAEEEYMEDYQSSTTTETYDWLETTTSSSSVTDDFTWPADDWSSTTASTSVTDDFTWPADDVENTAEMLDEMCYEDPALDLYCSSISESLLGVSFWDINYLVFSDELVDAAMTGCLPGHWCILDDEGLLQDRVDNVIRSPTFKALCADDTRPCIGSIVDAYANCSVQQRMRYVVDAVDLLCSLKTDVDVTQGCYSHVMAALHVTLADMLRGHKEQNVYDGFTDDTCKTQEAGMSESYLCLQQQCPAHTEELSSFAPWQWFIPDVVMLELSCNFEDCSDLSLTSSPTSSSPPEYVHDMLEGMGEPVTVATLVEPSTSTASFSDDSDVISGAQTLDGEDKDDSNEEGVIWVYTSDMKTMVCMSVATFIVVCGLVLLMCVCWKKHRTAPITKDGYSILVSDPEP